MEDDVVAEAEETPAQFLNDDGHGHNHYDWLTSLVFGQAELMYKTAAFLLSPIFSLLSLASDLFHHSEEAKGTVGTAVPSVPSDLTRFLRKLALGFLASAYVCMVLTLLLCASVAMGVGTVRLWLVEEPLFVTQSLYFDYTHLHPQAVVSFSDGGSGGGGGLLLEKKKKHAGIPVGHNVYVSLMLWMPDSDYNRRIGVFQVTAELISVNGEVIARSSRSTMLRFRSLPVRLMRTLIMSVPLLLGVSVETQKINFQILQHKESRYRRTRAIRVTLIPRAGTMSPPQVYEAQIIVNSRLPWAKAVIHNWKWTVYVWVSLYVYMVLLLTLLICCKPLVLPSGLVRHSREINGEKDDTRSDREVKRVTTEAEVSDQREEASEMLRKWRQRRGKRKAVFSSMSEVTGEGASASSVTLTRQNTSAGIEEDVGDSESVCLT